ncbi:MAG: hypothetical protein GC159_09595 [Phycisphaera sp.]|nr:hypothetical protein [Phycisphaera sp.]
MSLTNTTPRDSAMTRAVRCACCVAVALLVGCGSSVPQGRPSDVKMARATSVPMDVQAMTPVIEVMINGTGPYRMILDTGIATVAIDTSIAQKLRLGAGRFSEKTYSKSGGGISESRFVRIDSLKIGDVEFRGMDAKAMAVHGVLGGPYRHVDGLVGLRVFRDTTLVLDYPAKRVRVLPPNQLTPGGVDTLPSRSIVGQHIAVPIDAGGRTVEVMLDTGTTRGIHLTSEFGKQLPFKYGPFVNGAVQTPNGPVPELLGRLDVTVDVAGTKIERPIASVDSRPIHIVSAPGTLTPMFPEQLPILGGEILSHFVVTIDQSAGAVRFERHTPGDEPIRIPPVRTIFPGIDDAETIHQLGNTGMRTIMEALGITDPPLRQTDDVRSIEGIATEQLSYEKFHELMRTRDSVTVVVLRDGKEMTLRAPVYTIVP